MAGRVLRPLLVALVALVALTGVAGTCVAQAANCSPSAASLYADARRAFEDKRYDDSVAALRSAYACDPNPVYLANIARSYEEANRPKDALVAWQAYLAVTTDAQERTRTEGRISALTKVVDDLERLQAEAAAAQEAKRLAEVRASAGPPPPNRAPGSASPKHVPAATWVVLGAGGVGVATGVVLGVLAVSKHSAAQQQDTAGGAESMQSDALDFAHAANWSFAVGGAIGAIGVSWLIVELLRSGDPPAPPDRATFLLAPGGVGLAGRFR